jgi:archaemetzincin
MVVTSGPSPGPCETERSLGIPSPGIPRVLVAPMGPAPIAVVSAMEAALAEAFRLPVGRLDPIEEPPGAFSSARAQWSSVAFLETLLSRVPPGAARLLGVTERDLFVPVLSFVYGQAQLGGKVAVVSLARLRPEFHGLKEAPEVLARRAATESVHEVGHTFGLVHCLDRRCPMSLSIDLPDLDGKTETPCAACRALLEGSREMRRTRATTEGGRP